MNTLLTLLTVAHVHALVPTATSAATTGTFTIPTVPAIIVLLVNFAAPYLVSIIQSPLWPANAKKIVSIVVSVLLTAIVLVIAHWGFALAIPAWPQLIILGIVCCAFSYSVLLKDSADAITNSTGTGTAAGAPNTPTTGTAQSSPTAEALAADIAAAIAPSTQTTASGTTINVH